MIKVYNDSNCPKHYDLEEYCPHCDNMVAFDYDYEGDNTGVCLEAVCPYCGNVLMLCMVCEHCIGDDEWVRDDCDWCEEHGCHRDRKHIGEENK